MKSPHQTREKSHPDNPQADRPSDKLASQLPDLTPLQPIEGQREGDSADVKVIDSPLEHRDPGNGIETLPRIGDDAIKNR